MPDFFNAKFEREPQFHRTKSKSPLPTRQSLLLDPRYWYGMAATFLVFALVARVLRATGLRTLLTEPEPG